MTRKRDEADRADPVAERSTTPSPGAPRYSPEAVRREIDRDRRIKPAEARRIHALLRGRG
jgi:hypothetical protein